MDSMQLLRSTWLAVASTSLLFGGTGCQSPPAGASDPAEAASSTPTVPIVMPSRAPLQRTSVQPATVHAYYRAAVHGMVSGYVTTLQADIGQPVKQGDVLAVISVPEMAKQREAKLASILQREAEQRRAQANLTVAQASAEASQARLQQAKADVGKTEANVTASRLEVERIGDLVRQRSVADRLLDESQKKHDAARAEKSAAEAAVIAAAAELALSQARISSAEADLAVTAAMTDVERRQLEELEELMNYARLKAPFDGVVVERNTDLGDLVRNTQASSSREAAPLFVVAHLARVRIRVPVPERDAPLVNVGDPARVTLQGLPGQVLEGTVSRLAGGLDERTRTMMVEIDLENSDRRLLPGMFGQATIVLEDGSERLFLPDGAVRYDSDGRSRVYVVDNQNQIQVLEVTTGYDDGEQIEIVSGLAGTERVVGPMLRRLQAGQTVQPE